jgi:hypothetical protein
MLFAQSQPCEMHFRNQHVRVVQGTATFSKSKLLPSVEWLTHRVECREGHPPDTDSRLLTVINGDGIRSRLPTAFSRSGLEDRQPAKCRVGDSSIAI